LIYSENKEDIRDGVDILFEGLKHSKKVGEDIQVIKIANELFGHKLLEYLAPDNSDRISNDSMNILEVMLDWEQVYDICIGGLIDGMKNMRNNNEYTDYIRKFIIRLEKGNWEQLLKLEDQMKTLGRSEDVLLRTRALEMFRYFNRIRLSRS
jgi:hypothetical protein